MYLYNIGSEANIAYTHQRRIQKTTKWDMGE